MPSWGGLFALAVVVRLEALEGEEVGARAVVEEARFLGVERPFFRLLDGVLIVFTFLLGGAMLGVRGVLGVWDLWVDGAVRFLPLRALPMSSLSKSDPSPSLSADSLPPWKSSSSEESSGTSPRT
jgi:hypothetical protein